MSTVIDTAHAFSQLINIPNTTENGPLKAYQFGVKDVFDVKGFSTQAGNPEYFEQVKLAEITAPAVMTLQNAGAKLVGKTHTDELGGSLFGLNVHYGPPLNPHSPERVPGGSSSGSASAVASHLVDFALGADTSGSVRAPASFCGIYGFRPTFGIISTAGVLPISAHLDTVGIFARHPDIITQILSAYGMKGMTQFTRLRVIPSLVNCLQEPVKRLFLEKLYKIKMVLASTAPLILEEDQLIQWSTVIRTIAMHDLWQVHKKWILKSNPTFGEIIKDRLKIGRSIQDSDYKLALKKQEEIRKFISDALEPGDITVFPTVHNIPPLLSSTKQQLNDFSLKASRHTCIAALNGLPEMTIPLKKVYEQCSLGMSFLANTGEDYSIALFASKVHSIINPQDDLV